MILSKNALETNRKQLLNYELRRLDLDLSRYLDLNLDLDLKSLEVRLENGAGVQQTPVHLR